MEIEKLGHLGDENTKCFQNYCRHKKCINTIWGIKKQEGSKAITFSKIAQEGIKYFEKLFQEPPPSQV